MGESGRKGSANGAAPHGRVSVVIPAMNEADNLEFILPLLPSVVDEGEVLAGRFRVARPTEQLRARGDRQFRRLRRRLRRPEPAAWR